jgi:hypothetical protein
MRIMFWKRVKTAAVIVMSAAALLAGGTLGVLAAQEPDAPGPKAVAGKPIEAATEKKTFQDWVEVYKAEHEAALKAHPDLDFIERGAALHAMLGKGAWGVCSFDRAKHDTRKLTTIGKAYYDAFSAFADSDKGKAMFAKYKQDGFLNPEDQAYYWVIQATVDEYPNHNKPEGQLPKRMFLQFAGRAWKRDLFTRKEIDDFRKYNALKPKGGTTPTVRAYRLRGTGLERLFAPKAIRTGQQMPDWKFHYYETLMEQREYTYDYYKYTLHAHITPAFLETMLIPLSCFEYGVKDGKEFFRPDYTAFDKLPKDQYFDLAAEIKKGKPLWFIGHSIQDTYDYPRDVSYEEAVYWLFKDDLAFYHISDSDFMIGRAEYFHREDPFVELYPNRAVKEGKSTENVIDPKGGLISLAPKAFFRMPTKSVPLLLAVGGPLMRGGFGPPVYYVDKNGTQCALLGKTSKGYSGTDQIMWRNRRTWEKKGLVPNSTALYMSGLTNVLRKSIRFIKIMETLNWTYDAESDLLKSHYADIEDSTYQEAAKYTISKGTVVKLDREKRKIHVRGKTDMMKTDVERVHIIHFGERPRVITKGRRGGDINNLEEGDSVAVIYKLKPNTTDHEVLYGVSKDGSDPSEGDSLAGKAAVFLSGRVTAIDLAKAQCTVVMPKPDAERGEWKAFEMYEKELKPRGMKEPTDRIIPGWTFCKRLYYGDEKDRTFTLSFDDTVELSINGRLSTLDKVEVGDRLIFDVSNMINDIAFLQGVYVVKDGPLTGDELIFKPGE